MALEAFSQLHAALGLDLKVAKSERGFEIQLFGVTARFSYAENAPGAHPYLGRKGRLSYWEM